MALQDNQRKMWSKFHHWMLAGMFGSIFAGAFATNFEILFSYLSNIFYAGFLISATILNRVQGKKKTILQWSVLIGILVLILFTTRCEARCIMLLRMWIIYGYYLFMQWLSLGKVKKNTFLLSMGTLSVLTIGKLVSHPLISVLLLLVQIAILLRMIDPILYQIAMEHRKRRQQIVAAVILVLIGVCLAGGRKEECVVAADAKKYYVSEKNGKDSNSGTSKAMAFKTLKKAVQKAQDGDTVYLMDTQHIREQFAITKKITIGRSSEATGYLVSVEDDAKLTLAGDVIITGRKSTVISTRALIIVKEEGTLVVKGNAEVKNNVTDDRLGIGGAVYNRGYFYLKESAEIKGNETKQAAGGAIHNEGELYIQGGSVTNNTSSGVKKDGECLSGGGIINSGLVEMSGGSITNNTSTTTAGGIFNGDGSIMEMSGGTISNNEAEIHGGGVEVCSAYFVLSGGKITGNRAGEGGGIHLTISETNTQTSCMEMNGGEISGNEAVGRDGQYGSAGGVFANKGSYIEFNNGTIKNNTALKYAGGLYVGLDSHGKIKDGVTINGNISGTCGGGIMVREDANLEIYGAKIVNNQAESGGGIGNKGILYTNGIILSGNQATKGRGIYQKNALEIEGEMRMPSDNDIYLVKGCTVSMHGKITTPQGAICLTPENYFLGRVCVETQEANLLGSQAMKYFSLAEKSPYLLRPADALCEEAGVGSEYIILSRGYAITYQKNSDRNVTNMPQSSTAYWKEPYTLSPNIPNNQGHVFLGWNTKANGSGTGFQPNAKLDCVVSAFTFYALWKNEPPVMNVTDTYAVEDEIDSRVTKAFLLAAANATDEEDGSLTGKIEVLDYDSLMQSMKTTYTQEEKQMLCRKFEVSYKVEDSGGKSAERISTLTIFLIEEEKIKQPVKLRFISEKYIDTIRQDSVWNNDKKKEYLRKLFQKDKSKIAWKTIN